MLSVVKGVVWGYHLFNSVNQYFSFRHLFYLKLSIPFGFSKLNVLLFVLMSDGNVNSFF